MKWLLYTAGCASVYCIINSLVSATLAMLVLGHAHPTNGLQTALVTALVTALWRSREMVMMMTGGERSLAPTDGHVSVRPFNARLQLQKLHSMRFILKVMVVTTNYMASVFDTCWCRHPWLVHHQSVPRLTPQYYILLHSKLPFRFRVHINVVIQGDDGCITVIMCLFS